MNHETIFVDAFASELQGLEKRAFFGEMAAGAKRAVGNWRFKRQMKTKMRSMNPTQKREFILKQMGQLGTEQGNVLAEAGNKLTQANLQAIQNKPKT